MLLGRVLLSPIRCVKLGLRGCVSLSKASQSWHPEFISRFPKPPAHRFSSWTNYCRFPLTVCDMQTASIPHGPAVVIDDKGGDEDELEQEGWTGAREVKEVLHQLETIRMDRMEVQQARGVGRNPPASGTPASLSKRSLKQKMRKKNNWVKKKLKSSDISVSLMSELPFSATSPTTWKELGFTSSGSAQEKRKRKRGDSGGRVDSEEDAKKKKRESQRPNYFISVPITNTQISSAVLGVQEAVLQQEPRLARAMIPIPTLHITLLVTHLSNQEQVDLAASVLAQVQPSLAELLGGRDLVLPFSGISHFRKEVVFVGLAPGQHRDRLDTVADLLQGRFEEQGLLQRDTRGFEPHLTIMKLSRASKLRSQGVRRVDPALYSSYTNKFFGEQTVERLDLCSMLKKKQADGYYHTETSLPMAHWNISPDNISPLSKQPWKGEKGGQKESRSVSKKREREGGEEGVTSRRGKEAPWVSCAASRSPRQKRKSVSSS
ncbi:unnamed protein product [Tetraodon nigroviridis]|uniref:(spotted green pufferfish) hypothetical protein n=1 Tax=Tetraodon nigroviridis TaxID=99883 RepID=Q4SC39_TETNG|nr:unnamed protein product [Tetraodon nigroviridis]